jgi:phosphatidylserine/phosphatidylglycerophosphate/cardiolipin synthase-like enzyme
MKHLLFLFFVVTSLSYAQTKFPSTGTYELGFSPGGSSLDVVQKTIHSAQNEILIACYEFTDKNIALSIENAFSQGVKVYIVADYKASRAKYSMIPRLQSHGIFVRLNNKYSILHDKFIIVDRKTIETGSFNYTSNAINHNAENALLVQNVPDLANAYLKEWYRLWDEAK